MNAALPEQRPDSGPGPIPPGPTPPGRPPREPVFNLPGPVLAALAVIVVIFAIQSIVPPDVEEWMVIVFGFSPLRYAPVFAPDGLAYLWTPVTYSLLHGGIAHLGFNALWLAAFGTPVARRIGPLRFLLFWILSSIAGAAFHLAVNFGDPSLMIGASGVISGLMGSACRFAFSPPVLRAPGVVAWPRLSILQALQTRTVLMFTIAWLVGNLLAAFGVFGQVGGAIAWDAHLGGFLFGFLLFGLFDPQR
ncbi:rhomboid family intramembrane serine protease [Rhizobium halophytocola]|uniref:Membrane associated rhomboid family serine protease n=1 Tax=Rhizobium halophytocola TaxID=735519 RepID=A0ABS4DW84_9HYPH|nr:rhomboid family intramembrane serine protease [Rhizobium halophytocola]MBP1849968.1 membrane associated rhomboid family serine protease [Rhizobium halophytocola]